MEVVLGICVSPTFGKKSISINALSLPTPCKPGKTSVAASSRISSNRWPSRTACGKKWDVLQGKLPWSFGLLSRQSRIRIIRVTEVELRIYSIGQLWVNSDMVMGVMMRPPWERSSHYSDWRKAADPRIISQHVHTFSMRDQPVKKVQRFKDDSTQRYTKHRHLNQFTQKTPPTKGFLLPFQHVQNASPSPWQTCDHSAPVSPLCADHPAFSTACNRADLHQIVYRIHISPVDRSLRANPPHHMLVTPASTEAPGHVNLVDGRVASWSFWPMKSWSFLALCGMWIVESYSIFSSVNPQVNWLSMTLWCSVFAAIWHRYCHNEYPEHLPRLNGVAKVFWGCIVYANSTNSNHETSVSPDLETRRLIFSLAESLPPFQLNGWPIRKGRWTYDCWVSSPEPQEESKPFPCHGPLYLVILKSGTDIITKKHQKNWSQSSM